MTTQTGGLRDISNTKTLMLERNNWIGEHSRSGFHKTDYNGVQWRNESIEILNASVWYTNTQAHTDIYTHICWRWVTSTSSYAVAVMIHLIERASLVTAAKRKKKKKKEGQMSPSVKKRCQRWNGSKRGGQIILDVHQCRVSSRALDYAAEWTRFGIT